MNRSALLTIMGREIDRLTQDNDHSAAAIISAAAEALRTTEEQMMRDVRRLRLETGDVVVVTTPQRLSMQAAESIRMTLARAFDGAGPMPRVLVLDAGSDLKVVNAAALSSEG